MGDKIRFSGGKTTKPICCISPSRGISIIAFITCVNGWCIVIGTVFAVYEEASPLDLPNECLMINLLYIGLSSGFSSLFVLYSKGSRLSVNIWTVSQILTGITILILFKHFLQREYDISDLFYGLISFMGFFFCEIVFFTLVMIDFLTRSTFDVQHMNEDSDSFI